ncbi:MAG: hypothetical protein LBE50_06745 [Gallionellaceae bacterium]|jgi:type IV pilus assembly protein PilA|nr:hypothetical protein [Gallionellaceae bacterium]
MKRTQQGAKLLELMIVIVILGILGIVLFPVYQTHSKKLDFQQIIDATAPIKRAIEKCVYDNTCVEVSGDHPAISAAVALGAFGIPDAPPASGKLASVVIDNTIASGTIVASATAGLDDLTYVLKPSLATGEDGSLNVMWEVDDSSTCLAAGACKKE